MLCHMQLLQERMHVRLRGTRVVVIEPGRKVRAAMGLDAMNPRKRRAVAEVAYATMRPRFERAAELAVLAG
jgi:hypothetical protein